MKKTVRIFLICICCQFFLTLFISAKNTEIQIDYQHQEKPMENVEFSLYTIANYENHEYVFLDKYQEMSQFISFDELNKCAVTLAAYIEYYQIPSDMKIMTNEKGRATFQLEEEGCYLILAKNHIYDSKEYEISPSLILINEKSEQVIIQPKYSQVQDITSFELIKKWEDRNHSTERPLFVTVKVLQDSKVIQTIRLSEENHWRVHLDVEAHHQYRFVEVDIEKGYRVTLENEKGTVVITNNFHDANQKPLPNTGTFYWLALLLSILGVSFVFLGYRINDKKESKK